MAEIKEPTVYGDFLKYPSGKFVTRKNIFVMNSEELEKFFNGILNLNEVIPDPYFNDLINQYTELKLNEEFNLINRIKYGEILYKNNSSYFRDILTDFIVDFRKTHLFEWVSYSGGIEGEYDPNSVKIPVEDYEYLKGHHIILTTKFPKNCKITSEVAKLLIEKGINTSLGDVIVKTNRGEVHAFLFISPGYVERPVGPGYIKINKISVDGWENGTESFLSDSPFSGRYAQRFNSIGSLIQMYDFAKSRTFDPFTQAELEVIKDFSSKKEKEFRNSIKDDSLTSLTEAIGQYYPTLLYGRWDTDPKFKENLGKFFSQDIIDEFIESHTFIWESGPFFDEGGKKITIPINKWNDLVIKNPLTLSYEGVSFILPKTVEELEFTVTLEEFDNWFGEDGYDYLSPRDVKLLKELNPSLKKIYLTIQ